MLMKTVKFFFLVSQEHFSALRSWCVSVCPVEAAPVYTVSLETTGQAVTGNLLF